MNFRIVILFLGFIAMGNVFAGDASFAKIKHKSLQDGSKYRFDRLTTKNVSRFLGWIRRKKCDDDLCCGYYFENSNVINNPQPKSLKDEAMSITAEKPAIFTQEGESVIEGDVVMKQPGREITADKVNFFRDKKTGKIKSSIFEGDVYYREYGKLIVADKGEFNFVDKKYSADRGIYRLFASTPTGLQNVWGKTKRAVSDEVGVLKMSRATYTSCSPEDISWYVWGSSLTIDRNINRGKITNAFILFRKIPVFYTPYFSFPIDKKRESGFLYPTLTYSKDSGYGIDVPYYFNLAPNYDFTFSPEYFTRRGILLNGVFRYLTLTSRGDFGLHYIPHDRVFINFRDSATVSDKSYDRALKNLKESRGGRGFVSFKNESDLGKNWTGALNVNYSTDDYFLHDFNGITTIMDNNQLLNRADIAYNNDHWSFLGRLQMFQTLHPITHGWDQDQYKRLPQLNLSGDYPDSLGGLDYRIDTEMVHFMQRDNFYGQSDQPIVNGLRLYVMPSISAPIRRANGSIIPKVKLQATGYGLRNRKIASDPEGILRFAPTFSLDGNMFFGRNVNIFNKSYTQTLEPRLFYLFVPDINQDKIPLLDTYLPAFDINQLFRANRFNGIDRVGDANQITLALTSRLLDDYGQEKFNAAIGQIVSLSKHQVNIEGNLDPLKTEILSPLVGKLQYYLNPAFSANLDMAWDPSYQRFNTVNVGLRYTNDADRVVNVWYNYLLDGDRFLGRNIDLSRLGFSVGWKIWRHWNIIGHLNYNTGYRRAQNYLYGLEYNSCCWAMRFAYSRDFVDVGADNRRSYDSRYYIQFLLKGFGGLVDHGGLSDILVSKVGGYRDKFSGV